VMKPMGLWWRNVNEKDDGEDVFPAAAIEDTQEELRNSTCYTISFLGPMLRL